MEELRFQEGFTDTQAYATVSKADFYLAPLTQ